MTESSELRGTARAFVVAAFEALQIDNVIPTPVFHPYVRVGRDYYGDPIRGLEQYPLLEQQLNSAYPGRFDEPLKRRHAEFASSYMFALLEAAVARCGRARNFAPRSPSIDETIDEMLAVLDAEQFEVVCCRLVSHFTTRDGEPVQLGPIKIVPEASARTLERTIAHEIPGGPAAFNRDPPFAFDPPHSLLIARQWAAREESPFEVADRLSALIERFLLHMRLLTGGTVQSYYEVKGTTTLVAQMPPHLTTYIDGAFAAPVRRTIRVTGLEASAVAAVQTLINEANVNREGMAATSFDVAIRKFNGSYRADTSLEHLVNLATALEATLASGDKDNEGLTLRLRSRAAALLATDTDSAMSVFHDVGELYGLRSKLVHGGRIKEMDLRKLLGRISTVPDDRPTMLFGLALGHAVDRMRDLVRRAILARLCLAAEPGPLWPFDDAGRSIDASLADDRVRSEWRSSWHDRLAELGAAGVGDPPRVAADFLSQDDNT